MRHVKRRLSGIERATNSFPQATDIPGDLRSDQRVPRDLST
jgi:hypothetical protein